MEITKSYSRAQIEEMKRAEREAAAPQAPPKVRNASTFASLGEPRALRWQGHYYKVPPVPFRAGRKLLVIGQVLDDATNDAAIMESAAQIARSVLHGVCFARSRAYSFARAVLPRQITVPRKNHFRNAPLDEVRELIRHLTVVPNDNPIIASGKPASVIDMTLALAEFVREFPRWVNDEGDPVSWEHYQVGMQMMPRIHARNDIRAAQAFRASASMADGFKDWLNDVNPVAGW